MQDKPNNTDRDRTPPSGESTYTRTKRAQAQADPPTSVTLKIGGWVTVKKFAIIANISYPTAVRWFRLKMIHGIKVGGQRRIPSEEVARFLAQGTRPPDEQALIEERAKRNQTATTTSPR